MIYINNSLSWRASSGLWSTGGHLGPIVAWMRKIHEGFLACGLTRVTCTGEWDMSLDGTTTNYVYDSTVNDGKETKVGFSVYKMFSTTKPTVYVRVDFGHRQTSASATPLLPFLQVTCGLEVSAAGVLSGLQAHAGFRSGGDYPAPGYASTSLLQPDAIRPLYISSDGENYLTMVVDPLGLGCNLTTAPGWVYNRVLPFWFALERSIEPATGAYDGEGMFFVTTIHQRSANMGYFGFMDFTTQQVSGITSGVPVQAPALWNSSGAGGSNSILPITCCSPKIKAPMKACVYYFTNEIQNGRRFNLTVQGEQVTYMAIGPMANGYANNTTGSSLIQPTLVSPAVRFQ